MEDFCRITQSSVGLRYSCYKTLFLQDIDWCINIVFLEYSKEMSFTYDAVMKFVW